MSSRTSTADAGWSLRSSRAMIPGTTSGRVAGRRVDDETFPRSTSSPSAAVTADQNWPPSRSDSSTDSHAVGTAAIDRQSTSNDVLPDPAGATTTVIGTDVVWARSERSRGRRR